MTKKNHPVITVLILLCALLMLSTPLFAADDPRPDPAPEPTPEPPPPPPAPAPVPPAPVPVPVPAPVPAPIDKEVEPFKPDLFSLGPAFGNVGGLGVGLNAPLNLGKYITLDFLAMGQLQMITAPTNADTPWLTGAAGMGSVGGTIWVYTNAASYKGPNRHGIVGRVGYAVGTYPLSFGAIGYSYQRYKNRKHYYTADVGIWAGYFSQAAVDKAEEKLNDDEDVEDDWIEYQVEPFTAGLYWKFAWTWPIGGK